MKNSPNTPERATVVIASRESALALWQAEHVKARLQALYPERQIRILGLTTRGDQILDRALSAVGGKGLFVKELEDALLRGEADLAVHSMKDVPMHLPEGFRLAAISRREDPRDAFVSAGFDSLDALPAGAVVGTSSLRRQSQIKAHRPDLVIEPLRGNVGTRLRKLDEGKFAAIILAAAGLKRLGLGDRIRRFLSPDESLPAVGQGALGIECLASRNDIAELLQPLHDPDTSDCVLAERAMSRALAGSCQVPLGGFGEVNGDLLHLRGFVASPDGRDLARAEVTGPRTSAESLGDQLAAELVRRGADRILAALEHPA